MVSVTGSFNYSRSPSTPAPIDSVVDSPQLPRTPKSLSPIPTLDSPTIDRRIPELRPFVSESNKDLPGKPILNTQKNLDIRKSFDTKEEEKIDAPYVAETPMNINLRYGE
ncbi:hypothetical protein HK096_010603, partial [Nowakowskiella sp. JEL0078]